MKSTISSIVPLLLVLGGCATAMDYPPHWPKIDETPRSPCIDISGIYREVSDPRPDKGDTCPRYRELQFACTSLLSVMAFRRLSDETASSGIVEVKQTDDHLTLVYYGKENKTLARGTDYQCNAHEIELQPESKGIGGFVGPMIGGLGHEKGDIAIMKATDGSLLAHVKSSFVGVMVLIVIPVPAVDSQDTWWRWRRQISPD